MDSVECTVCMCFGEDVGSLICHHLHRHAMATVVQRAWLRYTLFRHASRWRQWSKVRRALEQTGAFDQLFRYSQVRREWRMEPDSWLHVTSDAASRLVGECDGGWWGFRTTRV